MNRRTCLAAYQTCVDLSECPPCGQKPPFAAVSEKGRSINTSETGSYCSDTINTIAFYFGKEQKDLSLGEAALLAAIPNSPTALRPDTPASIASRRQINFLTAGRKLESVIPAREEFL